MSGPLDAARLAALAVLVLMVVGVTVAQTRVVLARIAVLRATAATLSAQTGTLSARLQLSPGTAADARLTRRSFLPLLLLALLGPGLAQGSVVALAGVGATLALAAGALFTAHRTLRLDLAIPVQVPPGLTVRAGIERGPAAVTTGDRSFDDAVRVHGDGLQVLSLLTPQVRAALIELVRAGGSLGDGTVVVTVPADEADASSRMAKVLATARAIAEASTSDAAGRVLALALDDPTAEVRRVALRALLDAGVNPQPTVIAVLARAGVDVDDPEAVALALQGGPELRLAAAVRLAAIGTSKQVQALVSLRNHADLAPQALEAAAAIRDRDGA